MMVMVPGNCLPGIGIHGEEHMLTNLDLAYIGLVDVDLQDHLAEVLGDFEQCGDRKRCRDGLAGLDTPRKHNAIHGRLDDGEVDIRHVDLEIGLGLGYRGLAVVTATTALS
jgi:hypothetical protein